MPKKKDRSPRFENLARATEQYMAGKGYSPSTKEELTAALAIHPKHEALFEQVLEALLEEGIAKKDHNKFLLNPSQETVATGTLRLHARGFGFISCDDSLRFPQDIFIPRHLTLQGVDGDRVEVLVSDEISSPRGPEGKIIRILERGRTHLAGIITDFISSQQAVAYVPLLGKERRVVVHLVESLPLERGDRVVLQVQEWGGERDETVALLSNVIGNIRDPVFDIAAAIEEYQIRKEFPTAAIQEAQSFGTRLRPSDFKNRDDLRSLICVTIDPDTAKDFDDAISITKTEKGEYELGVHIADVSHYVKKGTILDAEASKRCNSTYFPTVCVPMLPPELSDHLCSLKPQVNRLAISALMHFSADGTLLNYRITRSVIRSRKRFSYREAKEVLDGKRTSPFTKQLIWMKELCEQFKRKRKERGSIEFALPELVILCDETGDPQGTDLILYDITHQMVEECMLKTNELIAQHLADQGTPLSYRIHEEPPEENLREFASIARSFGFGISDTPTVTELQELFEKAFESPHGPHLATNYIRKMRLAVYSPDNVGHYGLSLSHYCHFTSPIRRYIDLVNHRILFGESDENEHLAQICTQCSEQERISARAEGSVILLKKLRLLDKWKQKEPHRSYSAIVTKIKSAGMVFEINDLLLEGFLPLHQLDHDYFVLTDQGQTLRGIHQGYEYSVGSRIQVAIREINFFSLESDWYLIPEDPPKKRASLSKKLGPKERTPRKKERTKGKKQRKQRR